MNRDLFADLPTTLAEFGLTWACQSLALLLIGLLAGRGLRRRGPAVQSAVYRTTLVAVLACPLASSLLTLAGVDGISLRLPSPPVAVAAELDSPTPIDSSPPLVQTPDTLSQGSPPWGAADPLEAPEGIPPTSDAAPAPLAPAPAPVVAAPAPPGPPARLAWVPMAVAGGLGLWGLGSVWLGMRMLVAARRMAQLRGGAIPAGPVVEATCRNLAGRMRLAAPAVLRSPFLNSPCVEGLRRPAILLPEDDADADLTATLVHELAHLARRDGLWNLLRRLASALLWFQPLVWALSRRIEVAAEEVCDDHVVQCGADRARYAGLLLDLAGRTLPPLSPVGVGMVSLRSLLARRVVRILDSSRALSTRAGTRAVLATLLAGAAATVLAGLVAVGGREPQARAAEAPAPAEAAPKTISGRIVDTAGQPVPEATVLAIAGRSKSREPGLDGIFENEYRTLARATTDADGRFSIAHPEPELGPDGKPIEDIGHFITKPGFGLTPYHRNFNLPLVPDDMPVTGRVVDLEGKPVAGARVRPTQLFMPWPAAKDLEEAPAGWFDPARSLGYGDEYLATLPPIVTDADGRFRMDGIGRRRMVDLEITRPDLARKRVRVQTRAMNRIAEPPGENRVLGINEPGQYGADCTIAVEPTRIIEGVVRDAETGRPIPGTLVTAQRLDRDNLVGTGEVVGRTDAEGRYRLVGLPKCKAPAVAVFPPLDEPYFINDFLEVPVEPGYEPVKFDVALRRGRWITGRVFDQRTNEPVAAVVEFFPMLTNPRAKDYPNFDAEVTNSTPGNRRYKTDAQGRYRVPGLAGAGVVAARTEEGAYRAGFGAAGIADKINHDQLPTYDRINVKNYQAIRAVEPAADAETTTADLPLDPGGTLTLRLVDEAGAPVEGADTNGLFPIGANGTHFLGKTSKATVAGLEVGKPRTVLIRHNGRRIGVVVELPADGPRDGREQVVVLRPLATVTGRLVGSTAPQAIKIEVESKRADNITPPGAMRYSNTIDTVSADPDGRFRLDLLPAGGTYTLEARDGAPKTNGDGQTIFEFPTFAPAVGLTVRPGQVVDLGTFDIASGKKVEPPIPPAAATGPTTETRAGQVVGPDGKPVPGVTVRAVLSRIYPNEPDQLRPRREVRDLARATTDADGRYSISYDRPGPDPDGQPFAANGAITVFAQAPGFGPTPLTAGQIGVLVPDDVPITGRLVDPEGNPVAGATLRATQIALPRPDRPEAPLDRFDAEGTVRLGDEYLNLVPSVWSDADGRFQVTGIGRDRLVDLAIRRPGSALKKVHVATRLMDRVAESPSDRTRGNSLDEPGQHGARCTIVVEPERVIAGQVRDADTGAPIPDALVTATRIDANKYVLSFDVTARTDAEGRYRLHGLPKASAPMIRVAPPVALPYFDSKGLDVPAPPGYDPITFDVPLRAGVWVTGRVANVATGEPVMAAVGYFPYLDNPAAQGHPNFHADTTASVAVPERHRTDAAGRFRVVGLPGRGVVVARTQSGDYRVGLGAEAIPADAQAGQLATYDRIFVNRFQSFGAVDIPPGVGELARDLPVDPGGSILVRLVDEAGRPVEGAAVPHGRHPVGGEAGSQVLSEATSFHAAGLEPGERRTVVVKHAGRNLGAVLKLPPARAADPAEVILVLRPLATVAGRVVDAAGKPAAGRVEVQMFPTPPRAGISASFRTVRLATGPLDADGRFRVAGIPAGGAYTPRVQILPDQPGAGKRSTSLDLAPVTPEPGAVLDLGTLDAATGKPVAAAPAAGPTTATYAGQIVGPDGRPVAGATVRAVLGRVRTTGDDRLAPRRELREVARVTTDADGRYSLLFDPPGPGPDGQPSATVDVFAQAPGFGVVKWVDGRIGPLVSDDVPIVGRLVDLEGNPVAGATITAGTIHMPHPDHPWPAGSALDRRDSRGIDRLGNQYRDLIAPSTSDADGRFRVVGVGRDRLVDLEIRRPGSALKNVHVATRRQDRVAEPPNDRSIGSTLDEPAQYGAECAIVLEPERVIAGQVRDAITGEPIPDAQVAATQMTGARRIHLGEVVGRADAQGRYRLAGLPKVPALAIQVFPPVDRPYFDQPRIDVPASAGYDPVTLDVALRAGVWVTGRVTNGRTGAPVPAAVGYVPYLDNPAAPDYPNFRPSLLSNVLPRRHRTDAAGRFRVLALPGRGVVLARTDSGDFRVGLGSEAVATGITDRGPLVTYDRFIPTRFQAIAAVDIPPGVGEFAHDLSVDPGGATEIRIVDEASRPVAGANVPHGRYPPGGEVGVQTLAADQATFRATGLEPNQGRTVVVRHPARGIGAVVDLPADRSLDAVGRTVVLCPLATVSGRVVDATGRPGTGTVTVLLGPGGRATSLLDIVPNYPAATGPLDAAGRFRLATIPSGGTYRVEVVTRPEGAGNAVRPTVVDLAPITPEPGAVLDLGTVDAATGKPVVATPAAASVTAAAQTKTVTGRVVDAEGRPIAGAQVISIAARRGEQPAGPSRIEPESLAVARGDADAEGRFALAYVEPDPGDRMAWYVSTYASAPGYGPIRAEAGATTTLPRDDFPVLGRVVDLEGRPVAGASVRVQGLYESAGPVSPGVLSAMVTSNEILLPRPVATDAAGRFRIEGLGRDRLAVVALTGPTVAYREATVATRPGGWVAESRLKRGMRPVGATDDPGEHGAECTIALEPTQVIEGTVRDAATNEPIPGVTVASMQLRREFPSSTPGLIRTQTDAEGRYRLVGLPRNSVSIGVYPPADRPYFANREVPIPSGPGVEPIPLDIPLRAGIWITGRVADARTGAAVAAAVEYFPFLDNPAAAGYANFQPRMSSAGTFARARIDADGRYRVVGLPGRGVVVARTDDPSYLPGFGAPEVRADPAAPRLPPGRLPTYDRIEVARYQAVRAVDVPPDAAEFAHDLPVDPGGSLVLRPVDPAGRPVTGFLVRHDLTPASGTGGPGRRGDAPTIRIGGLAANQARTFIVSQSTLDLGTVLELPADAPIDGRELAVTLRPRATVVGRVVDAAGEPVGGRASVEIRPVGGPAAAEPMNLAAASADRDGRFRVAGIPTGVAATVRFQRLADERQPNGFLPTPIALPLNLQPGATVDLGTLDASTGKAVEAGGPSEVKR